MGKYNVEYHKEYYKRNKEKKKSLSRAWRKANPEKVYGYRKNEVDVRMRRVFSITLEDYERMSENQEHKCFICRKQENGKRLAIDHCHKTKIVRGLLCAKCNQGLGLFNDNINLMREAIKYVQRDNSNKKD